MYYAGLDLHKRYFTLCVLTSEGQVVQDHRRLPADLEPLQTILRDLGGRGAGHRDRGSDLAVGLAGGLGLLPEDLPDHDRVGIERAGGA